MAKIVKDENINNPGATIYNDNGTSTFSKSYVNPQGMTASEMVKAANASPTPQSELAADAVSSVKLPALKTPTDLGTPPAMQEAPAVTPTLPTEETQNFDINTWLGQAFAAPTEVKAPVFTSEKDQLTSSLNSRLEANDVKFANDLSALRDKNKNIANSLKAKLVKMNISPSDPSWASVMMGQMDRDEEGEKKLRSDYLAEKSKIETEVADKISALTSQEVNMKFQADMANINNNLQKLGQGLTLYNIFEQRSQADKDREQSAYNALLTYNGTMAGLDQKKQESIAASLLDNAQKGFYNVSDKATLDMLMKMQKDNPEYLSGLVDVATTGLTARANSLAQDALNMKKTEAEIGALNRSNRGGGGTGGTTSDSKFWAAAQSEIGNLQKGEPWGTVWNRLKTRFPNIPAETIDAALGGSGKEQTGWAKPGAFDEWKQRQYKETEAPKWQQQAGVWEWMASDEAAGMDDSQKAKQLMAAGYNPKDFGIEYWD